MSERIEYNSSSTVRAGGNAPMYSPQTIAIPKGTDPEGARVVLAQMGINPTPQENLDNEGFPESFTPAAKKEFKNLGISFRRSTETENTIPFSQRNIYVLSNKTLDFVSIFLNSLDNPGGITIFQKSDFAESVPGKNKLGILLYAKKVDFKDGIFILERSDGRQNYQVFTERSKTDGINFQDGNSVLNRLSKLHTGLGAVFTDIEEQRKGIKLSSKKELFLSDLTKSPHVLYIQDMPITQEEGGKIDRLISQGYKLFATTDMQGFDLKDGSGKAVLSFGKYEGPRLKEWLRKI